MNDRISYRKLLRIVVIGVLLYCSIQNYMLILNFLGHAFHMIFPFVLGGAIAFIINVPMRPIERKLFPKARKLDKIRRPLAYLITLVLILGVVALALLVIVPQVSQTVKQIIRLVPGTINDIQIWLTNVTENIPNAQNYLKDMNIQWSAITSSAISFLKNAGGSFFTSGFSVVSGIIGGVTTFFIAFVFSIYVLFQKETLARQMKQVLYALCSEAVADKCVAVGRLSDRVFSNFLAGQCMEAVILGSMFFVTMLILRLPYAILVGVVISLTALIPILGSFVGLGVGAFLMVMVDPMKALLFVVIFFVLQQIEGNLIYPRVVGNSIGLPSLWVLVAVSVGGSLMGVTGILLFIPFCSVCYALFREFVVNRLEEKHINKEKWEITSERKQKIVFFDIDGTLWDEDMQIPDSTKEAIRLLKEQGHKTFLCSGRARSNICSKELLDLGFDGIVAACGNHIEMDGKILYENIMSHKQVKKVIYLLKECHMPVVLEGPVYHWIDEEGFEEDPYILYLFKEMGDKALPLKGYSDEIHINKFSADILEDTDYERVKKELRGEFMFLEHEGNVVEFVPAGTSKATGIEWICNYLGIDHKDTYAVGDSVNDLDMLQFVEHGIAMGNGTDPAREVAEYITTDLKEDGIYHAMKHYGLI